MTGDTVAVPSMREYAQALLEIDATPLQVEMLRIHFEAPERTITATDMSRAFDHDYPFANLHYGRLGRLVGEKPADCA